MCFICIERERPFPSQLSGSPQPPAKALNAGIQSIAYHNVSLKPSNTAAACDASWKASVRLPSKA